MNEKKRAERNNNECFFNFSEEILSKELFRK